MHLDKDQQYGYNRYLDYLHVKASEALSLQIEAEENIRKDEKIKFAKSLFTTNLTNDEVAKHTGLTVEEVGQLRHQKA